MSSDTIPFAALEPFYLEGLITDVLFLVKGGKEASVYCCRGGPATDRELLAAKVFRPIRGSGFGDREYQEERRLRGTFERKIRKRKFKNDALYQEGRIIVDRRLARAFRDKSRAGREAQYTLWVANEYQTLRRLHAAGADVPRPFGHSPAAYGGAGGAVLMEYVGDLDTAAPLLTSVELAAEEAEPLFERLVRNIELWLACDRVHADLSAYNVLYWRGTIKAIDFPQAVDPQVNSNAFTFLARDIDNVCRYFRRYGLRSDPHELAQQLWTQYLYGDLQRKWGVEPPASEHLAAGIYEARDRAQR